MHNFFYLVAKRIPDANVSFDSIVVESTDRKQMSQMDYTKLVAHISRGCLLSQFKQWKLTLRNPILFSYVEIDITFENRFIQDFTYSTISKLEINISEHRKCFLLNARKNDFNYKHHGIITPKELIHFENYTRDEEELFSFITTIGFQCVMKTEGELPEPYYSSEIILDFRSLTVGGLGICNVRLYHPQKEKCGRPEIPANSRAIYPSERLNNSNKWRTKIAFECNAGYSLEDASDVYKRFNGSFCGLDGRYIGGFPFCKPQKICPLYESDHDLKVEYSDHGYYEGKRLPVKDTKAVFACKGNKTLFGVSYQQCKANGQWSSQKPNCSDSDGELVSSVLLPEPKIVVWLIALLVSLSLTMCCAFMCCMYFSSMQPRLNQESPSDHPILEDDDLYEKVPARIYVSMNMVNGAFNNGRVITNVFDETTLNRPRLNSDSSEWNDRMSFDSEENSGNRTARIDNNSLHPFSYPLVDNTLYASAECVN